jgi:5-methylcytosine-specific restriction endonuclease McrA
MSNWVFVIGQDKRPLDPIHPGQARLLLNQQKAAVYRRYPFTIILKKSFPYTPTQQIELKLDPGSKTTGIALVQNDKVIWSAELQHRGQQISDSLLTRRAVRRSRRQRHTRYRQARFLNRTRLKGWLAPSLMHRVLTTETWVKRLIKFAPITGITQELVKFDTQLMQNSEVSGIEYQQGELAGYQVREYLLEKWGRQCIYCGAKDVPLQIEHIVPRSMGGSNRVSNLTIACQKCNQAKGNKDVEEFLSGKQDLLRKIRTQVKQPLKDAAAVNSTRWALYQKLKLFGLEITVSDGGRTKFNRTRLGFSKTHWIDAACVGNIDTLKLLTNKPLLITCKGQGTRRLCRVNKFGFPCSAPRTQYEHGWRTGDVAIGKGVVGRVVVQSATRLEIRIDGKRHGGKLSDFRKLHSKDCYDYA